MSFTGDNEQSIQWVELPGIIARFVSLGPKGVCWIIDGDGKIWFNTDISEHNFFGGKWYQLSIGEYLVQDPNVVSSYWEQDGTYLSQSRWLLQPSGLGYLPRGPLVMAVLSGLYSPMEICIALDQRVKVSLFNHLPKLL